MRLLFCLLAVAMLAVSSAAQQARARIELKSGQVVYGVVTKLEKNRVVVLVAEGTLTIATADIKSMSDPASGSPGSMIRDLVQPPPAAPVEPAEHTPSAPAAESAPPEAAAPAAPSLGPDHAVSTLLDRFLWIVPQSPGHKTSLGVGLFIATILVLKLSSRLANLDSGSFGRCAVLAVIVLAAAALHWMFPPSAFPFVVGLGLLDVGLWFLSVRLLFRGDFYNGIVMLVSFAMAVLLAVLILQVASFLLPPPASV
jgi:hypothetical protein